jgi:hypothetical protein
MKKLTKKQAIDLLPAVVDGEATQEERIAFLSFIADDEDLQEQYRNSMQIKKLLADKLPRAQAPDHLRQRIFKILEEKQNQNELQDIQTDTGIKQNNSPSNSGGSSNSIFKPAMRYLAAAAVILFITLTTIEFLDRMNQAQDETLFVVENYTALHFMNAGGKLIEPHFASNSTTDAEKYLSDHYGIEMTVPQITGAQFAGIVISDFLNGFETPLLEYVQPEINETIYIFAFSVDQLEKNKQLIRNEIAVETCTTNYNFHVAEVNDHHVVSWMWDGNWYSAISNHNGYDLASLIEPLNYNP